MAESPVPDARRAEMKLLSAFVIGSALVIAALLCARPWARVPEPGRGPIGERGDLAAAVMKDVGSVTRSARSEAAPESAPRAASAHPRGTLLLLDVVSRRPPESSSWIARSLVDATHAEFVLPADGRVELGVGPWELLPADNGWSVVGSPESSVARDATATLWVSRACDMVVRVTDIGRTPIAAARVAWIGGSRTPREAVLAETDASGSARLSCSTAEPGACFVSAPGFRTEKRLFQPDGEAEMNVELWPDTVQQSECTVVEAASGFPLVGVEALSERGRVGSSRDGGRLSVPGDLEWLQIEGPDLTTTRFGPETLAKGQPLRVPRRTALTVSTNDIGGGTSPGEIFVQVLEPPRDCNGFLQGVERAFALREGRATLDVPRGSHLRLVALAGGAVAEAEFEPTMPEESLAMTFDASVPRLRIEPLSGGSPLSDASVCVEYTGKQRLHASMTADGALVVPRPDLVRWIEIEAPGCVPTRLVPSRRGARLDGHLELELARASLVTIRLTTPDGGALPGAEVQLSDMDTGVRAHPELNGAWPTAHPGWAEKRGLERVSVTGGDGSVRVALSPSTYLVYVSVPDSLHVTRGNATGYSRSFQLVVSGPETYTWTMPGMRKLCLSAHRADTLAPVEGFALSFEGGLAGAGDHATGAYWEGWVGSETRQVTVRAEGTLGTVVELPFGNDVTVRREVLLVPQHADRIRVQGDLALLAGREVHVLAERDAPGSDDIVWQHRARLDPRGCLEIVIPVEDVRISLLDASVDSGDALLFSGPGARRPGTEELVFSASASR